MITKYTAEIQWVYCEGDSISFRNDVMVKYTDHVTEMREVLEALREYAGPHGESNKGFEAWVTVNKYAHYLEEK